MATEDDAGFDEPDGPDDAAAGRGEAADDRADEPSPEEARLREIYDPSAVRSYLEASRAVEDIATPAGEGSSETAGEEPTARRRRDGRRQRRRRRRADRAARTRSVRRRRATTDEEDPGSAAAMAAADEREAVGRIDTDQDLFGDAVEESPAAAELDETPVTPDTDDVPDEEHVPATGPATGPDIGAFFSPQPARPPTIVDRLGRTGVALVVAFVVVAFGAVAVGLGWVDSARELVTTPDAEVAEDPPPGGWQPAVLVATTVGSEGSTDELRGLAVIASDRSTGEATVLLIPTATVTDVPGFGSFTLAEAWELGGSSLVAVTVDNLLGLRIDGVLVKDPASWAAWFEPVGGASIDIPSRIVARDGADAGSVRFEAGTEFLTPERIGEYLTVRAEGETELQSLPRAQQVIAALSRELADAPDALETVVEVSRTLPGTATPERLRAVLGELAEARAADAATTITVPIVPLGTGPDEVYRPDEERLDALMEDRFAVSREVDGSGTRMAVQILNGNARPGIGQDVADALADGRYRIVLTGNADRFTYRETRILIYSDDPADLAAAQDITERLGVGVIERSGTPQSVVDVTIIVGADFPPDG